MHDFNESSASLNDRIIATEYKMVIKMKFEWVILKISNFSISLTFVFYISK